MARKRVRGNCVYCLAPSDRLTRDHVLPQSWYPNDTPRDAAKPTVPSCDACNNRFSAVEADLLLRLAFTFGLADGRVIGIPPRAMRSIDPAAALSEKDRRHRAAKRKRLFREIDLISTGPLPEDGTGILPGFGPGEPGAIPTPIPLDARFLYQFTEKLVHGTTFFQTGRLIGPDYQIDSGLLEATQGDGFLARLNGNRYSYGNGFIVTVARHSADPVIAGMAFRVWQRLRVYATVWNPRDEPDPWDALAHWCIGFAQGRNTLPQPG